ncbi:MAG: endonuclease III [Candidatus Sungbacteria bacterium RIFCSPLOWO2_01_FULL_47_10]|uniref:Endonuclease III n=1 Tax=Candidatus Sungbacteria bacterium RIFCSPLOWO2_01_FULL_47_10 TaxID=1802276 RepID=A0A1G2L0Z7_9BACT|nr:MAG: endonuclease III [Candidatus Sungbacteria bacterium RIFCSPLOWO2_01_FULL_47_10]
MYNISSNRFGKEPLSLKQKHASKVLHILKKKYPNAKIALKYDTNFQLLVAVILSAQCTDKKVNEVTEPIFRKYKTAADFARIHQKKFETMIRPTGFYRAKAKNILETAKIIRDKFGGMVPKTMPEMLTLKGVARKTANVVLGNAYGVVEGIAVDTHVIRLSRRLGFSQHSDPVKIEQDLMKLLPKQEWFKITYRLIEHGRAICTAKDPRCDLCPLKKICPSAFQFPRFKK